MTWSLEYKPKSKKVNKRSVQHRNQNKIKTKCSFRIIPISRRFLVELYDFACSLDKGRMNSGVNSTSISVNYQ